MPLKSRALDPKERTKECDHPSGFTYTGKIPNTGPQVCLLCGMHKKE